MGGGAAKRRNCFTIGSFNVRGLAKDFKQKQLARDAGKYGVDVVCLQETKIKDGTDISVGDYRLITFPTDQIAYGNGFIVKSNISIYRCWRISDRISVLQIQVENNANQNYGGGGTSENRQQQPRYKTILGGPKSLKMKIVKQPPLRLITIVNVYAPTTHKVSIHMDELDKFYTQLSDIVSNFENLATSMTFIAGDFNAKIGKRRDEQCIGNFARGKRNNSGEMLINFCSMYGGFFCNTAFQHPARHITTWSRQYFDKKANKYVTSYSPIDYIIMRQNQKQILTDSRSYSGTEVESDHRLVVARLDIKWYNIYKKRVRIEQTVRFNTEPLVSDQDLKREYQDLLTHKQQITPPSENRWERLKNIILATAEEKIGYKQQVANNNNQVYDAEIAALSDRKRLLRVECANTNDADEVTSIKKARNKLSHEIRAVSKRKNEQRISRIIDDVEGAGDSDSRMFKAAKSLNRKRLQNQFVHDNEGKRITDPQQIHGIIRDHFKDHFQNTEHKKIDPFVGTPKILGTPIKSEEVRTAVKRMTNNRAPGYDNISVELVKYSPDCVIKEIADVLNESLEKHQQLNLGKGQLAALWKPNKVKGPVKHMRPVILLTVLRKILSNIALNRIKPSLEQVLSSSQAAYRPNRCTTDVVWAYRWMLAKIQEYVDMEVQVTGIDMSAAFDTINRQELLDMLASVIGEDELRMIRVLLSETTLEVKISDSIPEPFESNVGSPQGDAISGPLFTVYFEAALRELRVAIDQVNPVPHMDHNYSDSAIASRATSQSEHNYTSHQDFPREMIYADDADFLDTSKVHQISMGMYCAPILNKFNLKVNNDKTEYLTLKRGIATQNCGEQQPSWDPS